MDNLLPRTKTVVEFLSSRPIPWEQATQILLISENPLSHSSEQVLAFLVAAMKEILSESAVIMDINKRIKTGAGSASNPVIDPLILELTREQSLRRLAVTVVEKSTATFENIVARGRAAGERLDSNTSAYLRRKVFTETIVREIVRRVKEEYAKLHSKSAKDGFLFALSPEVADSPVVDNDHMARLMNDGFCVIKLNDSRTNSLKVQKELARMEALMMFEKLPGNDQKVCWLDLANPGKEKALISLCELMAQIPYELNRKKTDLMLQISQFFQLSLGPIPMHLDAKNNGRKFTIIVPVLGSVDREVVVIKLKNGTEIKASSSNVPLVIINAAQTEYECPSASGKVFYVISFLTGP